MAVLTEIPSDDQTKALGEGCALWIVTQPKRSAWARKVDWYLNSQIMRAELHAAREIGGEIRQILSDAELDVLERPAAASHLMIASSKLLPNETTVVVTYEDSLAEWVTACHSLWTQLRQPRVRLFLPDGVTANSELRAAFSKAWPEKSEIELVL